MALVHGLGLCREVWQWLLPDLRDRYRVVTYDLPGHGDTPELSDEASGNVSQGMLSAQGEECRTIPGSSEDDTQEQLLTQGNLSLEYLSAQLVGLLDHLHIERTAVVGFSLGGMAARKFAQDHAQRTTALGILHSPHRRSRADKEAVRGRAMLARARGPEATVEQALERWFTATFREENPRLMDMVRGWVLSCDPDSYAALYDVLAESVEEVVDPDPVLACPVLALTGAEDRGNGPAMAKAIASESARSEVVVLPELRHMALVENPEAVNGPLLEFLDRHLRKVE